MRITFLGTGTSVGIPTVGCDCETCMSPDPRDKRLRASILVQFEGRNVLIDASTDFRQQALSNRINQIDAILFTHAHADHCFGLDDTRPIMFRNGPIDCYASDITWEGLKRVYAYAFEPSQYPGVPRIVAHTIDGGFPLFGATIEPVSVIHGRLPVTAFKIGRFAYVTDCNIIPDDACAQLRGLDLLVIDALRFKSHPTHMTVDQSLGYIERLRPRRALLTHISHDIKHEDTSGGLPAGVQIAYDGLQVDVD